MPIYPYKCKNQHKYELVHASNEGGAKKCPECDLPAKQDFRAKFKSGLNFTPIFHGVFDHGKRRYINTKREVREIEKRENKIFAGDEELDQEADIQMKNRVEEIDQKIDKFAEEQAYKIAAKH